MENCSLTNDELTENPNNFVNYDKLLESSQFFSTFGTFFSTFVTIFICARRGFYLSFSRSIIVTIEAINVALRKENSMTLTLTE